MIVYSNKKARIHWAEKSLAWFRIHLSRPIYHFTVNGYAVLYMYTSSSKLWKMDVFIKGIGEIPYIGAYAQPIGWDVVQLEIILAIALILPRFQRAALWGSTLLMSSFTLYIAVMMLFVPDKLCHCGGVIEIMGWGTHLAFNMIWLALGIYAILQKNSINN